MASQSTLAALEYELRNQIVDCHKSALEMRTIAGSDRKNVRELAAEIAQQYERAAALLQQLKAHVGARNNLKSG